MQSKDLFFDGVVDGETVNSYVDGLVEAMDAVDRLFFYELVCGLVTPLVNGVLEW